MGRLPSHFAGRLITFRVPYSMPGELIVQPQTSGVQFPDATFLQTTDKPFEIHRMIPRLTQLDSNGVPVTPQPAFDFISAFIRLMIRDVSKNEQLMKSPQLVKTMVKGTSEQTWEFAEPYTIVRQEGFQISVDNTAAGGTFAQVRVEIDFQGFLLVVAPPSEAR